MKEYYNEVSYGLHQLAGVTADNGSGGFLMATVPSPPPATSASSPVPQRSGQSEGISDRRDSNPQAPYTGILYVFNNVCGCGWAGLAYVGWGRAYSNNTSTLWVISHELGHNFGLLHAGSLRLHGRGHRLRQCIGRSNTETRSC